MKIAGITAEYNPFHNGHAYHLSEVRRMTGADGVVAVMSGDFVQRGVPACTDKYRRTRMALEAGVDLVLELPVQYATGSAELFASGAIGILSDLGCITDIVYGCECGPERIVDLKEIARILADEPDHYKKALREGLRSGLSFPAARQAALTELLPDSAGLLRHPNNILAVEYEKALIRLDQPIRTAGLCRSDSGYHASGSALREALAADDIDALSAQVPESSLQLLDYHIEADDISALLSYALLLRERDSLCEYLDVTSELAARIFRHRRDRLSFSELTEVLAARNIPSAHVRRALLHILLNIQKGLPEQPFIRVLGFRKGTLVLSEIGKHTLRTLISSPADAPEGTWAADEHASDIYNAIVYDKYGIDLPDEYHAGPVMI